jgi:pyruvate/2-oxoglutarate dehydrogenase complex dihydrolipoamide acyltransferase (E2) component
VRFLIKQHNLKPEDIEGTGKDGRVKKEDVLNYIDLINQKKIKSKAKESHVKESQNKQPQTQNHHRQEEKVSIQGKNFIKNEIKNYFK